MTREEKQAVIEDLSSRLSSRAHYYLVDISGLNAESTSALRRKCYEAGVELVVVKNTLFRKALEQSGRGELEQVKPELNGSTSVFFSDVSNAPAKVIKDFRATDGKALLKLAYVEESVYVGDEQLDTLASLKSREELIADIIALLQSPAKNVISALQSGGQTLTGVLKTLSER